MNMSNEYLVLTDYSEVPDSTIPETDQKWREYCKELQEQIGDGKFEVLIPGELVGDKETDKSEEKCPTVFGPFGGKYYTKKYAGVLCYAGKTVIIHSRFDGESNKNYFLRYALEKTDLIPWKILTDMDVSASPGSMFKALLGQLFLRQLKEAYAIGVYREYRSFEYNDARPRGRLDIARHIRLNPLQNGKVAYSTREFTTDNPINHLILAAYGCLLARSETKETIRKTLEKDKSLRRPLEELGWSLGSEEITAANLKRILNQTERTIAHPLHRRYEVVRRTARMILKNLGLELFENAGEKVGGVLIPMDRLWELFLEKTVFQNMEKEAQKEIPVILDKEKKTAKRIFKPDFILRKEKNSIVLDAKYRKAWEDAYTKVDDKWDTYVRNDVFQVMSYMFVEKAKTGGILFPLSESKAKVNQNNEYLIRDGMDEDFRIIPVLIADATKVLHEETPEDPYKVFAQKMDDFCADCARIIEDITK